MAENDVQERSEEATPKRIEDARRKGQVARSRELVTLTMMATIIGAFAMFGAGTIGTLMDIMRASFAPPSLPGAGTLLPLLGGKLFDALISMLPLLLVAGLVAGLTTLAIGGWIFSTEALNFDWQKLDPIKGLGRIFSLRSLVELIKASLKFTLVGGVAAAWMWFNADDFINLNPVSVELALLEYLKLLFGVGLAMLAPLILIAAIDAPYQIWNHARQLRMTRRELKDDMKESEGDPELRARQRRRQQEAAQERRMLGEVPESSVVIANPTHFSVALRYEPASMQAPKVVAKGTDVLALEIRKVASTHRVPVIEAPPLARALFHSVKVGETIPEALYLAVAKVLAYVHDLRRTGVRITRAHRLRGIDVPPAYRRDET